MTLSTKNKIFIAKLLHRAVQTGHRLVGWPMHGIFVRRGIRWQLDLNEGIDFSIYLAGMFEPATTKAYQRIICPGDFVFDVGANMGAHTLPLAKLVGPRGRVDAFEPTLGMVGKLRQNCVLNQELAPRVVINHAFCTFSDQAVIPDMIYSSWPLIGSTVELHPGHLGRLNAVGSPRRIVLDEYVEANRLTRVNFIKLDVDGNEITVLKGAHQLLARYKPIIITEVAPSVFKESGADMEEFWSILKGHGYRMRLLNSNREIPLGRDYFAKELPEHVSINVILN